MSKAVGIFSNFGIFMMPNHQIWSCHVTHKANLEKFLCFPKSAFNIRKSYKISSRKPFTSEVISQKPYGGGGKHPRCF